MKKLYCLTYILIPFALLAFSFSEIYADTAYPFQNTVNIQEGETASSKVTFKNEGNESEKILLKVYGYDPENEAISSDEPILLRVDTDTFDVEGGETKDLPYEIVIPENTEIGTYFNLILLQPVSDTEGSTVTTTPSLSQIVEINVYKEGNTTYSLPSNPGNITIEILDRGIPFVKGASIKYTYTNTTNYVLQPDGELQIFNEEQNKEPEYIEINKEEKYLYPGEELTETFTIDSYIWSADDLIYDRVVLARFYNGIDGGYQGEKTTIQSFKTESIIGIVSVLLLVIILSEFSKGKGRKLSKNEEEFEEGDEE